jgi:hypothetical protein
MRTLDQIIEDASGAVDPQKETQGYLTRADMYEAVQAIGPDKADKLTIKAFLDKLPFISVMDKKKILDDLLTYGL